jgi:hypothetical protein
MEVVQTQIESNNNFDEEFIKLQKQSESLLDSLTTTLKNSTKISEEIHTELLSQNKNLANQLEKETNQNKTLSKQMHSQSLEKLIHSKTQNLENTNFSIENIFSKTYNVLPSLIPSKKTKQNFKHSAKPYKKKTIQVRRFVWGKELDAYESQEIEFKQLKLLKSQMICNYICGFLNAAGGTMLIGVDDDGVVRGISLKRGQIDEFQLELDRTLRQFTPPVFPEQFSISFEKLYNNVKKEIRDKFVVRIDVDKDYKNNVYTTNEGNVFMKKKGSLHCLKPYEIVNFMKRKMFN